MAKEPNEQRQDVIIQVPLEDMMPRSMMPYAEHVILERALPRVEDGLKPVQRRILYSMQELGLSPEKPYRKCARIVGDCLGKYHPHGDSSVYDALVRMAQPYSLRGVLVDGHGNFGSIDGDSAAAMRYTEARMAPLALQMLRDIEKDTVPFQLNFDDTLKEPEILPARYPNLLVNGASGIAVGLATNIPPHNLKETVAAACLLMDNENATTDELMAVMPAPDFPTGGVLIDTPELRTAYETGRGKLTLRAKVEIEKGSAGRTLLCITQVPYMVSKAQMLEKILKLSMEKKAQLSCIYDIRDESDRTGLRAVIELRKDADVQKTLALLYKYSDLQVTFGVNLFAIAQGKPQLMGIKTVLNYFIAHQKRVVTRRTQYDLDQARARAHILEALIVAVDHLDEVIALIRKSKNGREAKDRLMARFSFSDVQAQAILDLRLQRLTGLEIEALRKEYADVLKLIAYYESILNSEKKLIAVIKKELMEIGEKFGDARRTVIAHGSAAKEAELAPEEPVPEEAVVVLNRSGLLKRYFPRNFEKLEPSADPMERPIYIFKTETDHTLLFFTNKGNCYPLSVGALTEARPKDRGVSLSGVLMGLETDEKCVCLMCVKQSAMASLPDLLFVTQNGMIKRTAAQDYDVRRARFAALTLKNGDALLGVFNAQEQHDVLMLSRAGMSIRFRLEQVPVMGRVSAGVKGMKLDADDVVAFAGMMDNQEEMLVMTERGYGKSIVGAMFDVQGRAGKGVRCMSFNKNGSTGAYVAAALRVVTAREIVVEQQGGLLTPISSQAFPVQGLSDKGKPVVMAILDDIVVDMF